MWVAQHVPLVQLVTSSVFGLVLVLVVFWVLGDVRGTRAQLRMLCVHGDDFIPARTTMTCAVYRLDSGRYFYRDFMLAPRLGLRGFMHVLRSVICAQVCCRSRTIIFRFFAGMGNAQQDSTLRSSLANDLVCLVTMVFSDLVLWPMRRGRDAAAPELECTPSFSACV